MIGTRWNRLKSVWIYTKKKKKKKNLFSSQWNSRNEVVPEKIGDSNWFKEVTIIFIKYLTNKTDSITKAHALWKKKTESRILTSQKTKNLIPLKKIENIPHFLTVLQIMI